MISRLMGFLLEKQPPFLLIDVSGVGYELQASMYTFYRLPETGQPVTLHTHLLIREDAHSLFGFYDKNERTLFRTLLKVNGIGAKSALAILSSIEPDAFVRCVVEQNTSALQKLPGIGKKTAERLVIEMRDRLNDWHTGELPQTFIKPEINKTTNTIEQDAISALIALGYKPQDASRMISQFANDGLSREELIRSALRQLNN